MSYHWPGNVRELENPARRLPVMTDAEIIEEADLPSPGAQDHGVSTGTA